MPLLSEALGTPTRQSFGPSLIFLPTSKRWEPPGRQGLYSHPARLWASFNFVPHCGALGTPRRQTLCSHLAHLWASSDFAFSAEVLATNRATGAM